MTDGAMLRVLKASGPQALGFREFRGFGLWVSGFIRATSLAPVLATVTHIDDLRQLVGGLWLWPGFRLRSLIRELGQLGLGLGPFRCAGGECLMLKGACLQMSLAASTLDSWEHFE